MSSVSAQPVAAEVVVARRPGSNLLDIDHMPGRGVACNPRSVVRKGPEADTRQAFLGQHNSPRKASGQDDTDRKGDPGERDIHLHW